MAQKETPGMVVDPDSRFGTVRVLVDQFNAQMIGASYHCTSLDKNTGAIGRGAVDI